MPLIAVIVCLLIAIGGVVTGWVQSSAKTQAEAERDRAEAKEKSAAASNEEQITRFREFSELVGCREANQNLGTKDLASKAVEDTKKLLGPLVPADAKTLEDLCRAAASAAVSRGAELDQRDAQITELKTQIAAKDKSIDSTRTELQKQLDEEKTRSRDQAANDAARIANLEAQVNQKTKSAKEAADRLTAAQEASDREKADAQKKYDLVNAKNAVLNTKLAFTREAPRSVGEVVEVSESLPIGFISLGARDRVVTGMRFEIVDYDANMKYRSKGWAEVTKVEEHMSEARIEQKGSNLPIARGDVLLNPLFDPKGERKAVLVGRFPISAGGKKGVEARLRDLGIQVGDKVDTGTDYLILGDPDVSNSGEKQDLEANPEVISASKIGTLRYTLKELQGYFRRG